MNARLIGIGFMIALAIAVGLSSLAIGAILSTTLLIGPAATALRLTNRFGAAAVVAVLIGIASTWLGVLLAYDSYYWSADHAGFPVSSFIVLITFGVYLLSGHSRDTGPDGSLETFSRRRLDAGAMQRHARQLVRDLRGSWRRGGGMFSSFMTNTWTVATIAAVLAGVVGFFVVLRGSAFPAHAIPNSAFAGAAAANVFGFSSLLGLALAASAAAFGIATLGRRGRHDVVTAFVLVLGLAIGAIFLSRSQDYEPQLYSLLFGEVLGVSTTELLPVALLAVASIVAIIFFYRPLLLSSTVPDVAEARGVSSYRVELAFLLVLAAATALTVPVVGALLIFSLMIGPPAAARCFTNRPPLAIALSVAIALATVWAAIAASYEVNWPIGFFVGAVSAADYAIGRGWAAWRSSRTSRSRRERRGAEVHVGAVAGL